MWLVISWTLRGSNNPPCKFAEELFVSELELPRHDGQEIIKPAWQVILEAEQMLSVLDVGPTEWEVELAASREVNGNPLQYSCLETPMDRGAWRATVHRITESQTQLSDWTTTTSSKITLLYFISMGFISTNRNWKSEGAWETTSVLRTCCCSVAKLCLTLCNPTDWSTPGFLVPHHLLEFAQVHVHWISDPIQPSHLLLPSSPFAYKVSQHQSFQWVSGLISLRIDWFDHDYLSS